MNLAATKVNQVIVQALVDMKTGQRAKNVVGHEVAEALQSVLSSFLTGR